MCSSLMEISVLCKACRKPKLTAAPSAQALHACQARSTTTTSKQMWMLEDLQL